MGETLYCQEYSTNESSHAKDKCKFVYWPYCTLYEFINLSQFMALWLLATDFSHIHIFHSGPDLGVIGPRASDKNLAPMSILISHR